MRRILVVQHEDACPLGWMALPGLEVDVVRPDRGEALPDRVREHAGLVVLGGRMAAWEDDVAPWLPGTRALLSASVDAGTPVLGICLGAQLLAMATGGRVERGPAGPELGVVRIQATPAAAGDALLGGLGPSWPGPQGHYDAVTELPPGAVLLAGSEMYPHQAFRVGERAWGLQYHPEATAEVFAVWMAGSRAALEQRGSSTQEMAAQFAAAEAALADVAVAHGAAFARVVQEEPLATVRA